MMDEPMQARGTSHPLGKCDSEIKTAVPEALRNEVIALAVLRGQTPAEYLRDLLTEHVYGRLHTLRLADRRERGRSE